jgi:rieske iron-sulfur protein
MRRLARRGTQEARQAPKGAQMKPAQATPPLCDIPQDVLACLDAFSPGRRSVLKALGLGLGISFVDVAAVLADDDPRMMRPQDGDRFVFALGDREGQPVSPGDLPLGGPQQAAYAMDPGTKVARNGSFLNQVVLIRLDPAQLTEDTRALAAEGVVAYSIVCTHQGCPVSMWQAQAQTLFCACHGSQFDPRDRARVIDGPATRRLPMLPVKIIDGVLMVAGKFTGRVGAQTG